MNNTKTESGGDRTQQIGWHTEVSAYINRKDKIELGTHPAHPSPWPTQDGSRTNQEYAELNLRHNKLLASCKLVASAMAYCEEIGGEHSPALYLDELRAAIAIAKEAK